MPRTKLGADSYKDADLIDLIRRYQGRGRSDAEVGEMLGMCAVTFRRRMKLRKKKSDPQCWGVDLMSIRELRGLQKGLGIPVEELVKYVF